MERIKLNIQKFASDQNTIEVELVAATEELSKSATKTVAILNKMKKGVSDVKNETYGFKDAAKEITNAFSQINFSNITSKIKRLGTSLYDNFLSKAIDTSEELNLFNVVFDNIGENGERTFSELGKHATAFQKKLNEAFGTNMKETMRYQGLFQAMGESAGLNEDVANLMSENMTKLAYDLASLYNTTETKAAESLRAGVYAGQTKPLRNYGIDVTQTSFKPLMEELGLEKSVNELTQAEKEILRYISTLNQAKNAMGDFANTIESPANQLKILKQQFYEMQAAIGNLFVGAFSRILPYVNAIIMVIKEVARAIAGFFGIEMEDYNTGLTVYDEYLDDYSDSLGGVADSADDATGSIKALKRQVLGFDQINNLTSPTPSSGGGSSGGGGAGGSLGAIDDKLLAALRGYDNGMDKVRMKANQIRDKMMEILGFTRDINGEWEWGGFSKLVKNFKNWFSDLDFKGKVLVVTGMITGFTALFNVLKGFGKLTGVSSLFKTIGSAGGKLFAGGASASGTGATAGGAAAGGIGIGAGLGVVAGTIAQIGSIIELSSGIDYFTNKFKDFADGKGMNFTWLDKLRLAIDTMLTTTNGIWGPLLINFKQFKAVFSKEIEDTNITDILNLAGVSKKTKETLGVVLKDFEDFTRDLNTIMLFGEDKKSENGIVLGKIITQENVDELKRLFGEATEITKTSLEEQKNTTLTNLTEIKDKLGSDYDGIKEKIEQSYKDQTEIVDKGNQRITEILDKALSERGYLTQEEMDEINKIRSEAQEKAITNLSDSEAEMLAIKQTMGEKAKELNVTQASELLQKSAETRDKTIEDAKTQYDNILREAEKLKEAGLINDTEYKKMRKAAEDTYKETVDNAKLQHQEIYDEFAKQNEDIAKYIDEDTGEVMSKWKRWTKGIGDWWHSLWNDTEEDFQNNTRPKLKKDGKQAVEDVNSGIKEQPDPEINIKGNTSSLKTTVDGAITYIDTGTASIKVDADMTNANNTLSWWKRGLNAAFGLNLKAGGGVFANGHWQPIQAYANGGLPSGGQLFMAREAGPELVGKIGRHTAVMNNNQIVDSVKAGVYEAVSAALSNGGMGSVQIDLHTDEGVVVDRINKITRQTGECPINF